MHVIELKDLAKVYDQDRDNETTALTDVDAVVDEGEFVAIMGPSGSGKSTLMNILGLLDTPTGGEYFLDGKPTSSYKESHLATLRRQKIGFVFQSFNLLGRLNVRQNVELPLTYAGLRGKARSARAMELLAQVGLADRANYRPNQISGGQTQRVAIARALANKPSLILADEPTGNLDTKSSEAIMDLLRTLNKQGVTVVVVTHNPEVASHADRILAVRDGRVTSHDVKPPSAEKSIAKPKPKPKRTLNLRKQGIS